jgi:hypothetical protein
MATGPSEGTDHGPTHPAADSGGGAEPLPEKVSREEESERRGHRRHAVANLRVKGPVDGDVLNTSHLGMAIQTNDALTVGWSYAFRMRNGAEVIRIPGKVQWCRLVQLLRVGENEFLPVFRMGVHLAGNLWGKPQNYYYP